MAACKHPATNGFDVLSSDECTQPYHLVHRRDLHNLLKSKAIEQAGEGTPVTLKLSSRIVDVDHDGPSIMLDNGERFHGDVVIGADGVHVSIQRPRGSWARLTMENKVQNKGHNYGEYYQAVRLW